jgi:hypothetical protein
LLSLLLLLDEPLDREGEDFEEDRDRVTVDREELPEDRLLPTLDRLPLDEL